MDGLSDSVAKVQCPHCQSRLDVMETSSGARTISVVVLGPSVEHSAVALEMFEPPDSGPSITCPACSHAFDPSGPRPIPPLRRRTGM